MRMKTHIYAEYKVGENPHVVGEVWTYNSNSAYNIPYYQSKCSIAQY